MKSTQRLSALWQLHIAADLFIVSFSINAHS